MVWRWNPKTKDGLGQLSPSERFRGAAWPGETAPNRLYLVLMAPVDKQTFFAELNNLTLRKVKENLGLGLYAGRKKDYANEWVRQKEQAIADKRYEQDSKIPWYQKPLGIVLLMVIAGLVVAVVVHWSGLN